MIQGIKLGLRISEMNSYKRKQDKALIEKIVTAKAVTSF